MREIQASEFESVAGAGKGGGGWITVFVTLAKEAYDQAKQLKEQADSGERVPANDEHTNAMGDTY